MLRLSAVALLLAAACCPACERRAPAPTPAPSGAEPAPLEGTAITVAGLTITIPSGWTVVPPANQMRLAEVHVPTGDDGSVCLITFSTARGDVQENIRRWAGQVKTPDGASPQQVVQRATIAGMPVTIAEFTGDYAGMGQEPVQPNATLRGAIVEAPSAMLFIKMTGPAQPMTDTRAMFNRMLHSMKPAT